MEGNQERHFTLHLMEFMFRVTGVQLPEEIQKRLEEYSPEKESYFTESISKAIFIFIDNFNSNDFSGGSTSTLLKTQIKLKEIELNYSPETFLQFLAHYSLKSTMDFCSCGRPITLNNFYNSIIRFLIKKVENGAEFWEELDASAKEITADQPIKCKLLQRGKISFRIPMTDENGFVLECMNFVFDLFMRDLPYYMHQKRHDFEGRCREYLTTEIRTCIMLLLNHQAVITRRMGEPTMRSYYREQVKNSFNESDFLELCVCYSRKAVIEYYEQAKILSPMKAFDVIASRLEMAKDSGKFTSFEDIDEAAKHHLDDEAELSRPRCVGLKIAKITAPPPGATLVQRMMWHLGKPKETEQSSSDEERQSVSAHNDMCDCCTCS